MNRIARFFVALSVLLAAPGLSPYQAAAQTVSATRVSVSAVPAGGFGAIGAGSGAQNFSLSPAGLQAGLVPALGVSATPNAALLTKPAAVSAVEPLGSAVSFSAPAALIPSALKAVAPSAAIAEKPAAIAAAPAAALNALRTGAQNLAAAAKDAAKPDASRVALDSVFEGSQAKPEALSVAVKSAPSDAPRLDKPDQRAAKGPRWVKNLWGDGGGTPRTSVKRTLSVGFLGAVLPIIFTMVTVTVAQLLGYHLHPNYQGPTAGVNPSMLQALAMWVGAAIMAPVSEEAIFRGGLQGRLAKLAQRFHLGSFVAPAIVTSLVFVALHETSDPVLFFTRFVHALALSWIYKKEGILASMAAHGFFNGLLALSVVLSAAGLPWLGLAAAPVAAYFAWRSAKVIRAQKPEIASGALAPKPLSAKLALAFAALLMLGYFFIMPNIFWPLGAVALLIKALASRNEAAR